MLYSTVRVDRRGYYSIASLSGTYHLVANGRRQTVVRAA